MDNRLTNDRSPYSRLFAKNVPYRLAIDMARVAREAHRLAFSHDVDFLPGVQRDMYPIARRAHTETGFYHLAGRYKDNGVVARERKNAIGNYSHVELISGSVIIIPAAVEGDDSIVREAVYRSSLATNPQMAMLTLLGEDGAPQHGDALLAVVLYGPSSAYPKTLEQAEPGFVTVRFPVSEFTCYAEGRIDLLQHLNYSQLQQRPPIEIALWPEEMAQ